MVILLRVVGIPARFVTGYVPGELVREEDERTDGLQTYQVVERHAHAWPEVFFPTYGWIQFEPTASEPTLTCPVARPAVVAGFVPQPEPTPAPEEDDALRPERGRAGAQQTESAWLQWLRGNWVGVTAALVGSGLAIGLWLTVRRRRQGFLRDPHLVGRLFDLLAQWAGRLRVPWPASHTPLEHGAAMSQRLPEAEPPIRRLAGLFVAEQYGQQEPSPEAVASSIEDWRGLQPIFWRGWLRRLVRRK